MEGTRHVQQSHRKPSRVFPARFAIVGQDDYVPILEVVK
jgi:hypothetical protein